LRQFVDAREAQHLPYSRYPGVVLFGQYRTDLVSILDHRSELADFEELASSHDSQLREEHRTFGREFDGDCCKKKHRGKDNQPKKRRDNVERLSKKLIRSRLAVSSIGACCVIISKKLGTML